MSLCQICVMNLSEFYNFLCLQEKINFEHLDYKIISSECGMKNLDSEVVVEKKANSVVLS